MKIETNFDITQDKVIFLSFSRIVMPMYVEYKIFSNLPLSEGQDAYESWKRPPVTPVMNLYIFNITNTEAFLNGKCINFLWIFYLI